MKSRLQLAAVALLVLAVSCGAALTSFLRLVHDADEDAPALDAGMRFFLLTDNLYNRSGREISNFSRGSWEDLERFLDG